MSINRRRSSHFLLAGVACLVMIGCGGREYDLAPVSGKVTLDGEPLAGALVVLQPTGGTENPGPGSTGLTDDQGVYVVKTIDGEPGAVVGQHRVSITSNPYREAPAGDRDVNPVEERVPQQYNLRSKLTLDVPEGGVDTADFKLTSR